MPQPFGSASKTFILKSESHKLHEEFEVDALKVTVTGSADFVTSNVINGKVNNIAIAPVTFATSHAATATAVAAAIAALGAAANVASCTVSGRIFTIKAFDTSKPLVAHEFVTTLGASQNTYTYASDDNKISKGQPVKLTTEGKIEPFATGDIPPLCIGFAVQDGLSGDLVTVIMKAFAIVYAEAYAAAHVPGTVRLAAWNAATKMMEVDDGGTQDHTTIIGHGLDAGADGDVVRVALLP